MEAVFLKLLEMSLYGSLLILAILPLRVLLKNAPRQSICLLWVLATIALVCPVRMESAASVMPSSIPITNTVTAPALPTVQTDPIIIPQLPVENGVHIITHTEPDYTNLAATVWVVGMAVMLLWAAVTYLRLRRRVAVSIQIEDKVCICDDIDTPFILGIVRPRIYLPSALDSELHEQVLLHERAHLKRRDHWWKPLGYLLLTLHWFNPLVWLAYGLLCRDIELACDEKVIRNMDTQSKKDYSEALLRCSMPRHLITACPLAFGEVSPKQRIKAVLNYKKPAFWLILITFILCLALAVTFLTRPKLTTLGEMSSANANNVKAVEITSKARHLDAYPIIDEETVRLYPDRMVTVSLFEPQEEAFCDALAQVQLRKRMGNPAIPDDHHAIRITIDTYTAPEQEYSLYFSEDCTRLWIITTQQEAPNRITTETSYYAVENPEFLTGPLTLGKLSNYTAEDVKVIHANHGATAYFPREVTPACDLLSKLELRQQLIRPRVTEHWDTITLVPQTDGIYYYLTFSPDYSGVLVIKTKHINEWYTQRNQDYYQILNPEVLINAAPTALTTEYLDTTATNVFSLDSSAVTMVTAANNSTQLKITDRTEIDELCAAANHTVFSEESVTGAWDTDLSLSFTLSDNSVIELKFDSDLSCGIVTVSRPYNGTLYDTVYCHCRYILTPKSLLNNATIQALLDITIESTDTLTPTDMERLIGEYLTENNRHFDNLQLLGVTLYDESHGMTYTMCSLDHLSHDGTVTAENCLYLAGFANGRMDGMVSGEWGMSAGYYPNVADFNGNLILWTTRSSYHLALNDDGTLNADAVEPNEYTSYRVTCNDGSTYFWDCYGSGSMCVLPKGQKPVKIAPVDSKGNEAEAFAFYEEYLTAAKVNTISMESGHDMFLQMNMETGKIEIITSHPAYAGADLYLDMDSSFVGHKPLYAALCDSHRSFPNLKLLNEQSYQGYEYAVIQYDGEQDTVTALVEYTIDDSAVTLLTYAEGYPPDTQGFLTGYHMNCASMEGGIMYWSLYDRHYAVTDNGTTVDHTQSLYPDFTHFQFTMRDLETHTFPAGSAFFLCEFTTVIPPAIVTPMENGNLLSALGSEAPALSYNTYSFVKD